MTNYVALPSSPLRKDCSLRLVSHLCRRHMVLSQVLRIMPLLASQSTSAMPTDSTLDKCRDPIFQFLRVAEAFIVEMALRIASPVAGMDKSIL